MIQTIDELLLLPPESIDSDLGALFGSRFNHLPEVEAEFWELTGLASSEIEIRYYKNFYFDSRRFWRLASVWFQGRAFMVIQNAGREGDDYFNRFVFEPETYKLAVLHVKQLFVSRPVNLTEETASAVVGANDPISDLTRFYGNGLGNIFRAY